MILWHRLRKIGFGDTYRVMAMPMSSIIFMFFPGCLIIKMLRAPYGLRAIFDILSSMESSSLYVNTRGIGRFFSMVSTTTCANWAAPAVLRIRIIHSETEHPEQHNVPSQYQFPDLNRCRIYSGATTTLCPNERRFSICFPYWPVRVSQILCLVPSTWKVPVLRAFSNPVR